MLYKFRLELKFVRYLIKSFAVKIFEVGGQERGAERWTLFDFNANFERVAIIHVGRMKARFHNFAIGQVNFHSFRCHLQSVTHNDVSETERHLTPSPRPSKCPPLFIHLHSLQLADSLINSVS